MQKKKSQTQKSLNQLELLFRPFLLSGQITHIYAACGQLDACDQPFFTYEHQPFGETSFDLASLTKALVIAPLYWREFSKGAFFPSSSLKSASKDFLVPEYDERLMDVKVDSLLEHRSGLAAWKNIGIYLSSGGFLKEKKDLFFRKDLFLKEQHPVYSDIGYMLLGFLLEHLFKSDLSQIFKKFLFDLNFDAEFASRFCFDPSIKTNCIPTGYCPVRRIWTKGVVHDENSWFLGGKTGHAGLFSSGGDLWNYLSVLTSSSLFKSIFLNHTLNALGDYVFGWQRGTGESSRVFCEAKAFGHLGFTGTAFWYEPSSKKLGILLTNRVISSRTSSWITPLRKECFQIFNEALL